MVGPAGWIRVTRLVTPTPRGSNVSSHQITGGYLLANNVDRAEADRLRRDHPGAIVSRNHDGTYRVTRGR